MNRSCRAVDVDVCRIFINLIVKVCRSDEVDTVSEQNILLTD